jgi:hypothetical protein
MCGKLEDVSGMAAAFRGGVGLADRNSLSAHIYKMQISCGQDAAQQRNLRLILGMSENALVNDGSALQALCHLVLRRWMDGSNFPSQAEYKASCPVTK